MSLLKDTFWVAEGAFMDQVGFEHPPPYDPMTNGSVENGVRLVNGHLGTMKDCLKRKLRKMIPEEQPLMSRLVEQTARLLTARLR